MSGFIFITRWNLPGWSVGEYDRSLLATLDRWSAASYRRRWTHLGRLNFRLAAYWVATWFDQDHMRRIKSTKVRAKGPHGTNKREYLLASRGRSVLINKKAVILTFILLSPYENFSLGSKRERPIAQPFKPSAGRTQKVMFKVTQYRQDGNSKKISWRLWVPWQM